MIIQWNCEGIKSKVTSGDIPHLIKLFNAICLVVCETKLPPDANFKIKGFKSYLKNCELEEGQNAHGGVGIFVKNFVSSYKINLQTPLQAVAVSIKYHKRITVCSIYLPPNEEIEIAQLQNLVEQLPKPFLILGDVNAHHPMWYDPRPVTPRGITIADFIEQNDIALLDRNKMTHIWKVDKTLGHIDISMCSEDLLTWFRWDVHDEPLNSDHFPILLESGTWKNPSGNTRWLIENADWELFKKNTEIKENINNFNSAQEAATFFENHINLAASKSIPRTKGNRKEKSPPWWNGQCRAAIWKRKAAFRKYRRVTSRYNYNLFSKARAEARKIVRKSKRQAWTTFINSINHKTTSKEAWRKIHMLNNTHKSELVNTLTLNKKVIKISNIPTSCKTHLIKELYEIGCIQTIHTEENANVTSVTVRFETDAAAEVALNIHGNIVEGYVLKAEIIPQNGLQQQIPVLDEPKDVADCLGRRFAYISSGSSRDPRFKENRKIEERKILDFDTNEHLDYNSWITLQELEYALSLTNDSAPGPDDICYSMLKNLAPSGKTFLLSLFNCIFKEGKFPKQWKEAYIIPILKEGKLSTSSGSYRPIALTSCLCKVLERIINKRLVWFLEKNNLFDKYQSGYRQGRSPLDCLAALATEIHDAFRRGEYLFCVFFDLEKAYDTCWKKLIMNQLYKFGLRGRLPYLISNYLTDRLFRVRVGSTLSEIFEQEMGVPQGGVLSCTLFSIAINTVAHVIKDLVTYSLYVDDKRIAYAHSNPDICVERIQRVLQKVQRWALETGFRFAPDKTEWMIFHRTKPIPSGRYQFTLDGTILKEVTIKKFLGLIFDRMLTWVQHIQYLRGKCIKALNIVRVIARGNRQIDTKTLLRIYRALVRTKIDYGCQIYGTAPKSYLLKLDPIHHKGLRLALGAYRSSPIQSLYVETGEPSLQYRRDMLQMQYYARVKQFLPHKIPVKLDNRALDFKYSKIGRLPLSLGFTVRKILLPKYNIQYPTIAVFKSNSPGPWAQPRPDVCLHLANYHKQNTSAEVYKQTFLSHKHSTDIEIYTDGSKSNAGVGAGLVSFLKGTICFQTGRRLNEIASIFTAELYAIKIALLSLKVKRNIKCVIYTDSLSTVQALKNTSKHFMVTEILELLLTLKQIGVTITFCWVPGHAGIMGNELADEVAKASVSRDLISTQEIPFSDVKSYIKRKVVQNWQQEWETTTIEDVKLKEICPIIKKNPIELGLSRRDNIKLIRLRIGHARLVRSYHFSGEDVPVCNTCNQLLTVKHILLDCRNYLLQRLRYYNPRNTSLKELLSEKELVLKVLNFLKSIKLYTEL